MNRSDIGYLVLRHVAERLAGTIPLFPVLCLLPVARLGDALQSRIYAGLSSLNDSVYRVKRHVEGRVT